MSAIVCTAQMELGSWRVEVQRVERAEGWVTRGCVFHLVDDPATPLIPLSAQPSVINFLDAQLPWNSPVPRWQQLVDLLFRSCPPSPYEPASRIATAANDNWGRVA